MALITDINAAGASSLTITCRSPIMQLLLNGTWNGATVSLQKHVASTWVTIASYTDNAMDIIETVGSGMYRTNTTHGTGAPVLVCDVTFSSSQAGRVEAA